MKKLISIFILLIFSFSLISCSYQNSKFINLSTKPNNHYYADELTKKILNNENYTLSIFDTNLYKEIIIGNDDSIIIENFLTSLSTENFLPEEDTSASKEVYRLKISFNDKSKYIIKVFNSSLITLSPWDGNYSEDFISMESIPLRYNLLDFCTHIQNKPLEK